MELCNYSCGVPRTLVCFNRMVLGNTFMLLRQEVLCDGFISLSHL